MFLNQNKCSKINASQHLHVGKKHCTVMELHVLDYIIDKTMNVACMCICGEVKVSVEMSEIVK